METLTEQITREHVLEQASGRKAVNPDDIPISYESITDEWLTHIICKGHNGARVVAHRLDVPDEGNTNRRRIYIDYNPAGNAAPLPSSIFCKASHKLANRLVLAKCGLIQGEVTFYNTYRPRLDVEAPRCLLATYSERSYNSIVVLDDMARDGVEFRKHTPGLTRDQAESQMSLLARLHAPFFASTELRNSNLLTFKDGFDAADKWFDLKKCCANGFRFSESVIPSRLFRRHEEIWPLTLRAFDLHATMPQTFTHNDPHLRNWYIAASGHMGLADWQTFARGHWGRDVAYTISTALEVEDRRLWERELLQLYLDQLQALGGPAISFDHAWKYYRQHLLDSLAWWTLTITPSSGDSNQPPPDFQPQAASLAFICRMASAIDDLDALGSFD